MHPSTSQDLVAGIDFTGLSPNQTADQHNQLVTYAIPKSDVSDHYGVGFNIGTRDLSVGIPDIPNPEFSADYNKWYRYVWIRKPNNNVGIPKLYIWNQYVTSSASASDVDNTGIAVGAASFLKWVLVDVASNTTVNGGNGTPLQDAIDTISSGSIAAIASAAAANASVSSLSAAVFGGHPFVGGSSVVLGTTLWDVLAGVKAAQIDDAADIAAINTAISGSATDPTLLTGGMQAKIVNLQTAISNLTTGTQDVANIKGFTKAGMMIRSNAANTAAEWFSPTLTDNLKQTSDLTGVPAPAGSGTPIEGDTNIGSVTLGTGVWKVTCFVSGSANANSIADQFTNLRISASVAGGSIVGPGIEMNYPLGGAVMVPPVTMGLCGILTVAAAGSLTLSVLVSKVGTPKFFFHNLNFVAERISVATTL